MTEVKYPNLALGYCHRPNIPHVFLECMVDLYNERMLDLVIREATFFIASGRNLVVKQFLESKKEWLLFVDDDIIFRPHHIDKIMSLAHKELRPILAGLYFSKISTDTTILPIWLERDHDVGLFRTMSHFKGTDDQSGIQRIDVCGMGFTLIHRCVFETLELAHGSSEDDWVWFGHDIVEGKRVGEDTTFCIRAANEGFPIYGVSSIQLPHLKSHPYTIQMFLDQEKNKKK